MKSTRILEPLPAEMVDSEKKQHKQRWKEIQIEINKSESQKLTFEQFCRPMEKRSIYILHKLRYSTFYLFVLAAQNYLISYRFLYVNM